MTPETLSANAMEVCVQRTAEQETRRGVQDVIHGTDFSCTALLEHQQQFEIGEVK